MSAVSQERKGHRRCEAPLPAPPRRRSCRRTCVHSRGIDGQRRPRCAASHPRRPRARGRGWTPLRTSGKHLRTRRHAAPRYCTAGDDRSRASAAHPPPAAVPDVGDCGVDSFQCAVGRVWAGLRVCVCCVRNWVAVGRCSTLFVAVVCRPPATQMATFWKDGDPGCDAR
jgi:hypothetical protein